MMNGPLLVALVLALCACGPRYQLAPLPPHPSPDVLTTLFLIGDAGDLTRGAPIIEQLRRDIGLTEESSDAPIVVVFLGDNVYDVGVRSSEPGYSEDTLKLSLQLAAVEGTGAQSIFLPGNHDWARGDEAGWEAIRNQQTYLESAADRGVNVALEPSDGCPGPTHRDYPALRLITLDTQWFLHDEEKPRGRPCLIDEAHEVVPILTELIDGAGQRTVVVASHHPLRTHGPHGGYFPADRHLFPLLDLKPWAFLPLPLLGTVYVLARRGGASAQDLSGDRNVAMRALLDSAFAAAGDPPLFHAAGHEHSLQVLQGYPDRASYLLVSGSGSKSTPVGKGDETMFATDEHGYMKLELTASTVRLTASVLDGDPTRASMGWCRVVDRRNRSVSSC